MNMLVLLLLFNVGIMTILPPSTLVKLGIPMKNVIVIYLVIIMINIAIFMYSLGKSRKD